MAVEFVVLAAQWRDERVGVTWRSPATDNRYAWRVHRNYECRAMALEIDAGVRADIDFLGIGWAGMDADLAADH
jgi:hypothetical protein